MLALASHTGAAVQLAANSNSAGISGSQSKEAPSMQAVSSSPENQRAVVKTKGNVKDNRLDAGDDSTLPNDAPQTTDTAAPSQSRRAVVKTKGNVKNQRAADSNEVGALPSVGQPEEGKLKGKVLSAGSGGLLNNAVPAVRGPACATTTNGVRLVSCPKGINQAGIK